MTDNRQLVQVGTILYLSPSKLFVQNCLLAPLPTEASAISKITPDDLRSFLLNRDWPVFSLKENEFDMNQGLTLMMGNLQEEIDTLTPEKTVTPRKQTPPWINAELHLSMSKQDATNRRYSRTGFRQLLDKFLNLANLCEENKRLLNMLTCTIE